MTPLFFNPDEIEPLVGFLWLLYQSEMGLLSPMTGAHQTYSIVSMGEKVGDSTAALTLANYILLRSQFMPAFFDVLHVQRMGGYQNFFFRPLIFDHYELLKELILPLLNYNNIHELTQA